METGGLGSPEYRVFSQMMDAWKLKKGELIFISHHSFCVLFFLLIYFHYFLASEPRLILFGLRRERNLTMYCARTRKEEEKTVWWYLWGEIGGHCIRREAGRNGILKYNHDKEAGAPDMILERGRRRRGTREELLKIWQRAVKHLISCLRKGRRRRGEGKTL